MVIQETQLFKHSHEQGSYSADASELGFPPGIWPTEFESNAGGESRVFSMQQKVSNHFRLYATADKAIKITVFND